MTNLRLVFNNIQNVMELLIIFSTTIIVLVYLLRPTSKKEEENFNSKNNWRGGF